MRLVRICNPMNILNSINIVWWYFISYSHNAEYKHFYNGIENPRICGVQIANPHQLVTFCRFAMGGIFTTNVDAQHKTSGYHKLSAEHKTPPIANVLCVPWMVNIIKFFDMINFEESPEGASPLCAKVTPWSISRWQGGLGWPMHWSNHIIVKPEEYQKGSCVDSAGLDQMTFTLPREISSSTSWHWWEVSRSHSSWSKRAANRNRRGLTDQRRAEH